eukprot:1145401-Pelagomonas_calceolata.AAC.6
MEGLARPGEHKGQLVYAQSMANDFQQDVGFIACGRFRKRGADDNSCYSTGILYKKRRYKWLHLKGQCGRVVP